MLFKTTVNWLSNDICYLVVGCFDWKIGVYSWLWTFFELFFFVFWVVTFIFIVWMIFIILILSSWFAEKLEFGIHSEISLGVSHLSIFVRIASNWRLRVDVSVTFWNYCSYIVICFSCNYLIIDWKRSFII